MPPKNAWEVQEPHWCLVLSKEIFTYSIKIGTKCSEIQIIFYTHQLMHTPTPMKIQIYTEKPKSRYICLKFIMAVIYLFILFAILSPFQIISCFDFFLFSHFAIYLDILFIQMHNKMNVPKKSKRLIIQNGGSSIEAHSIY